MDINRLMAEAVARHGVKLDANDPAMVIVTLNRLMLEEAVRGVADEIRKAAKEFDAAGERHPRRPAGMSIDTCIADGQDP